LLAELTYRCPLHCPYCESGLDNIQLSFQAVEGELADRIAGVRNAHEQKLRAAELIQGSGIALSLNVVVHRFNIDRVEQIIDFAEKLVPPGWNWLIRNTKAGLFKIARS
jgi:MoaA/NifB/PqqE/SkfB family radical SAM enzyme